MFIKSIELLGFRNYLEASLVFSHDKTIILGKNAEGKSNLLEVIQVLSHLRSRRQHKDSDLINFNLDQAIIKARATNQTQDIDIALLIRKSGRRTLKVNDVAKKPGELLHNIYSVSFMADDLDIINGSPTIRRQWIDSVISQMDKAYATELDKFDSALTQRNKLLKNLNEQGKYHSSNLSPNQRAELGLWDELFISSANAISTQRKNFISQLEKIAEVCYRDISASSTTLKLDYTAAIITAQDMVNSYDKDLARSFTNIGPHRDDCIFSLDDNQSKNFASQGEKRSITLALKLAELELLKQQHGEYPILLLDDVLAELDEDRQDYLLESIKEGTQVIITTTHLGKHLEKWSQNAQIVSINNGQIIGATNNYAPQS